MSNLDNTLLMLQLLEGKVKNILSEKLILEKTLKDTQIELFKLKSLMNEQNDELKNFQNQHKITKIVGEIADDTNSVIELRMMLNKYIRDIDKCIAQLSD